MYRNPKKGYYGIGVYHAKNSINIGTLWRTAWIFGAAFIFTIGRRYKKQASDTINAQIKIPLFSWSSFDEFKEHLPSQCRLVGIEMADQARMLSKYCHPTNCAYLLGAEDHGLPEEILDKCNDVIQLGGESSLNVATAGSIVIYHRMMLDVKGSFENKGEF